MKKQWNIPTLEVLKVENTFSTELGRGKNPGKGKRPKPDKPGHS